MENTEKRRGETTIDAFKNRRVFTTKKEYWGIPGDLFLCGLVFCIGLSAGVLWWAGLAIGGVYFPTIYKIHKSDPRAAKAWLRGMTRKHSYWAAGEIEPLAVKYLPSRGGENLLKEREEQHNEMEIDCFV